MKIKINELKQDDWIKKALFYTLPRNIIDKARMEDEFNVKVIVNGIKLSNKDINDLLSDIKERIEREAIDLKNKNLSEAERDIETLTEKINDIVDDFKNKYGYQ